MRNERFVLLLSVLFVVLCIPGWAFNPATQPAERNTILFSWDGVQRDHLKECLSRNELPNLAALISEGKMVNIDISNHQTDTKAGHTQMLTGYDPELTGVFSNGKFKAIPVGLTIFERLEKAFGDDKITTIMLTGKAHHIGASPPTSPEQIKEMEKKIESLKNRKKPTDKARKKYKNLLANSQGEPWYLVSKNFDVWDGDKARDNTIVGPLMTGYLDKYGSNRFFSFFHFSDPDHKGHGYGENSKEYNDAIIVCDKWLGETVKKLKDLGIYDKTMIFVTADHGFDENKNGHSNAPSVVLASNVKNLEKDGDQKNIVPTILTEMGVDISKMEPKYPGAVLAVK